MADTPLLAPLREAGVSITVLDDGRLFVTPKSRITRDLDAYLRQHRDELAFEVHVADAMGASLARIEAAWPLSAPLGVTWHDETLADLAEAVNVAVQRRDRPDFDQALAEWERHVLTAKLPESG
jgi:hypothetical protein